MHDLPWQDPQVVMEDFVRLICICCKMMQDRSCDSLSNICKKDHGKNFYVIDLV